MTRRIRRLDRRWKHAVITGGSAGIGLAFAETLAAAGSDLMLVARDGRRLDEVAVQLRETHGVRVDARPMDLSHAADLDSLANDLADREDLDLLVNNVGGGVFGRFHERTWCSIDAELGTNLLATVRLSHAAVGPMTRRGFGSILNVAAGTAFYPTPFSAPYGAAKAFVVSLTEATNYELRGTGVTATAVCPGFTRTEGPVRHGFDVERVPGWWWSNPQDVARIALRAAARGRPVVSPGISNVLAASIGRHMPRRIWVHSVARTQLRLRKA